MAGLTYSQVEAALFRSLAIHSKGEKAFRARIKQWQKAGFPEGVNVGKGVRAEYGATQFFQLVLLGWLIATGLSPERGMLVLQTFWKEVRSAIYDTVVCLAGEADHLHYLAFRVNALVALQHPEVPKRNVYLSVSAFTSDDVSLVFRRGYDEDAVADFLDARSRISDSMQRDILLTLDDVVGGALGALAEVDPSGQLLRALTDDLRSWGQEGRKEFYHRPPPPGRPRPPLPSPDVPEHLFEIARKALSVPDREAARALEPDDPDNRLNPRWLFGQEDWERLKKSRDAAA